MLASRLLFTYPLPLIEFRSTVTGSRMPSVYAVLHGFGTLTCRSGSLRLLHPVNHLLCVTVALFRLLLPSCLDLLYSRRPLSDLPGVQAYHRSWDLLNHSSMRTRVCRRLSKARLGHGEPRVQLSPSLGAHFPASPRTEQLPVAPFRLSKQIRWSMFSSFAGLMSLYVFFWPSHRLPLLILN